MKLIVGLGNPGARYRDTYHNLGFAVIDELARRYDARFESAPVDALMARARALGDGAILAKPLTYMNASGAAVSALQHYYRIDPADLLVVLDDVALPVGQLRMRRQGSAGGHNGLRSIIEAFGSEAFARLRVGVGRGDTRRDLADYVLGRVHRDHVAALNDATVRAADAVESFVVEGIEPAMNRFNAAPVADENP
jgi:PTH1 family peptidyl-tRNA hydrolase